MILLMRHHFFFFSGKMMGSCRLSIPWFSELWFKKSTRDDPKMGRISIASKEILPKNMGTPNISQINYECWDGFHILISDINMYKPMVQKWENGINLWFNMVKNSPWRCGCLKLLTLLEVYRKPISVLRSSPTILAILSPQKVGLSDG